MWSYNYTTLYAHVIPKFPIDKLFRDNRKSQEACIMCPHSSRQFLPFTALSNYVFTFQENIFQLPLTRCEKIVTFNVFIHSSVCLFFLCPFWGWEFMFLWTKSFSFKEKWYWPDWATSSYRSANPGRLTQTLILIQLIQILLQNAISAKLNYRYNHIFLTAAYNYQLIANTLHYVKLYCIGVSIYYFFNSNKDNFVQIFLKVLRSFR